jgi:hypothetical protein
MEPGRPVGGARWRGASEPPSARLEAFLANPYVKLLKAGMLLLIGVVEASSTLVEDVTEKRLRVGHGLILLGLFGVLEAMPRFLEASEARREFAEARRAASEANRAREGGA